MYTYIHMLRVHICLAFGHIYISNRYVYVRVSTYVHTVVQQANYSLRHFLPKKLVLYFCISLLVSEKKHRYQLKIQCGKINHM